MSMRLEIHTDFDLLRDVWLQLEEGEAQSSLLTHFAAVCIFRDSLLHKRRTALLSVWDGKDCLGLLPVQKYIRGGFSFYRSLAHLFEGHTPPLIRKGMEQPFLETLFTGIVDGRFHCDCFSLRALYTFSPFFTKARDVVAKTHIHYITYGEPTYCIDLTQSFDEYFNGLSRNLRRNSKRYMHQLQQMGTVDTLILYNEDALDVWETFLDIEDSGWKSEGGTSLKRQPEFQKQAYVAINRLAASCGQLFIALLRLDGKPIAAEYCIVDGGIVIGVKSGFDLDYAHYSPANLLLVNVTERLIAEQRAQIFHLLPNDFGYKQRFCHSRFSSENLLLFSDRIGGRVLYPAYKARMAIKNTQHS